MRKRIVATQAFTARRRKDCRSKPSGPAVEDDSTIPERRLVSFVCLRDELPLRVRTIGFRKLVRRISTCSDRSRLPPTGKGNQRKTKGLRFKVTARAIVVDIGDENSETGIDHFILDCDFPFLLREWKAADGCTYRLKNSLKADYQKYLKNGDREKALKDPMLRHPD